MSLRDLYIDYPQAAYLLIFVPILLFFIWRLIKYRQSVIKTYASPNHLSELLNPRSQILTFIKYCCLIFAWILACLALMGPKGNLQYVNISEEATSNSANHLEARPQEVIFLVDTSASMQVSDASNGETRLQEAKETIDTIVELLNGQTISLFAFTSQLTELVPPTLDYIFTRLIAKDLHINEGNVGGTNIEEAFKVLNHKLFSTPSSKYYYIVLLSDGGDSRVEALKGEEKIIAISKIIEQLPNPEQFHLRIFSVGLGSEKGGDIPNMIVDRKPVHSRLESTLLKEIAQKGNGQYYPANDLSTWDLATFIVNQINKEAIIDKNSNYNRTVTPVKSENMIYDLYYQIPLGLVLLLLLMIRVLPDTWKSSL
ncbi:MAG: VWA domain-containing protein [Parachlamydiaceae bacterium]|nr:VWA domain-containing protein [Parachlamydiaceae bacterium]